MIEIERKYIAIKESLLRIAEEEKEMFNHELQNVAELGRIENPTVRDQSPVIPDDDIVIDPAIFDSPLPDFPSFDSIFPLHPDSPEDS